MHWDYCGSSVSVLQEMVAAPDSHHHKTCLAERGNQLLA
jgi:hypothetical protein